MLLEMEVAKVKQKVEGVGVTESVYFLLQDLKSNVQFVKFCTHAVFQSIVQ